MTAEPTVFVVDDDLAMRESLRWLIESVQLRVEVFSSSADFQKSYNPSRPGCLVLDVRMPGQSGLDLQKQLASRNIEIPIIIITGHADVPMAIRAMKQGAVDFIEKPFNDQVLLERIAQCIERDAEQRALREQQGQVQQRFASLTVREREVLTRIVGGKANKVVADELGLSPKTIEVHRASVMRKMEAQSLAELVRMTLLIEPRAGKP